MHTRKAITEALQKLGVQTGDLLMVHASLKAIGPVEGGAETVVAALRRGWADWHCDGIRVVGPITLRGDSEWRSAG
ncbi:hypothetical protein ECZU23_53820 [Escherichia coli]|nr:hypothetical protein ECZU23_53820 [Escherichia coli]